MQYANGQEMMSARQAAQVEPNDEGDVNQPGMAEVAQPMEEEKKAEESEGEHVAEDASCSDEKPIDSPIIEEEVKEAVDVAAVEAAAKQADKQDDPFVPADNNHAIRSIPDQEVEDSKGSHDDTFNDAKK